MLKLLADERIQLRQGIKSPGVAALDMLYFALPFERIQFHLRIGNSPDAHNERSIFNNFRHRPNPLLKYVWAKASSGDKPIHMISAKSLEEN